MSLKKQFAIYSSILFSAILGVVLLLVLWLFTRYRSEEFRLRLEEKAISTIELLVDAHVSEKNVIQIIDKNDVDKLFDDKILIFDAKKNLIYSNVGGEAIRYSFATLDLIKQKGSFYEETDDCDRLGITYRTNNKDYFVIVSAADKYGYKKIQYLRFLMLFAFLIGTVSIIVFAYTLSSRVLSILEHFQKRITGISENKLHVRLEETGKKDELDLLAHAFNQMMERIDVSYKQQKEFTDNASHELRTPITRIMMQVQNLIKQESHSENTLKYLQSIMNDSNQMADIISSLLLLSRIDKSNVTKYLPPCRLDEVIFEAIDFITKTYPDFHILFNIENDSADETNVEIKGDANLLKIVFTNLLKNAYLYSSDKKVQVIVKQAQNHLNVEIINAGPALTKQEQTNMFTAFTRGANAQHISGTGLGLRITERIVHYHNAKIAYSNPNPDINCFISSFDFE